MYFRLDIKNHSFTYLESGVTFPIPFSNRPLEMGSTQLIGVELEEDTSPLVAGTTR